MFRRSADRQPVHPGGLLFFHAGRRPGEEGRDFLIPDPRILKRLIVSEKLLQWGRKVFVRGEDRDQCPKRDPAFDDEISTK